MSSSVIQSSTLKIRGNAGNDKNAHFPQIAAALAQKCLDAQGVNCQAWENEIDARVAALYGIDLADLI